MSKQVEPIDPALTPLNGYSTAIQTCVDVASGKSKSRLRLDAAVILLQYCAEPPLIDWGVEPIEEDDGETSAS